MAKSHLLNYVGWYNGIGDHLKTLGVQTIMTISNVRIDVHIWEVNCKIFSKQDLCSFFQISWQKLVKWRNYGRVAFEDRRLGNLNLLTVS